MDPRTGARPMGDIDLDDPLRRSLVSAWHQYLTALDPIRPDLFRYCRRLTGNLWDAEDLVQDTLLKAFANLSLILYTIRSPRAYLLRIATNLWLDTVRSRATERSTLAAAANDPAREPASPSAPSPAGGGRGAAAA